MATLAKETRTRTVRDYLADAAFIAFIFECDAPGWRGWKEKSHHDDSSREAFEKAKYILTHIDEFNQLSDEEKAELKERIRHRRCVAKKVSK